MPMYWVRTAVAKFQYSKAWAVKKEKYGPSVNQYYLTTDLKSQPQDSAKPWVIYLHGGAWTFGSPEQFLPAARPFIEAGYRVMLPSYRRLTHQNFDGIWNDLKTCLSHYQNNYGGAGPTILAGMSGGGHLTASLASNPNVWKKLNWKSPETVILCGSVLDLDSMPDSFGIRKLAGKRGSDQFNRANPAWWMARNDDPPAQFLLVHGDADKIVALDQSLCYFEVLKKKNTQVELMIVEGGTHLDSGRWMYREGEVYEKIERLVGEGSTPSSLNPFPQ